MPGTVLASMYINSPLAHHSPVQPALQLLPSNWLGAEAQSLSHSLKVTEPSSGAELGLERSPPHSRTQALDTRNPSKAQSAHVQNERGTTCYVKLL